MTKKTCTACRQGWPWKPCPWWRLRTAAAALNDALRADLIRGEAATYWERLYLSADG